MTDFCARGYLVFFGKVWTDAKKKNGCMMRQIEAVDAVILSMQGE